ncbi:MAG: hypothetical protein ABFD69_06720 [Candidatus Sumerlaeia bacterium]
MAKQAKKTKERKPSKIEIYVRENPARVTLIALGVLLLLRIGLFMGGESQTATPVERPVPTPLPTPIVFDDNFRKFVMPRPAFDKSSYEILASGNIFDPKQVQDIGGKGKAAEEFYRQAQSAFEKYKQTKNRKDLDDAVENVNKALENLPSHFQARRLRDNEISKALGVVTGAAKAAALAAGNATTTGTAAAATPAPGAAPEATPAAAPEEPKP